MLTALGLLALACLLWPGPGTAGRSAVAGPAETAPGADDARAPVPPAGARGWSARLRGRLPGGSRGGSGWVADFGDVVAVGLDAGLDLGSAVVASARSPGVLERAPWLHARVQASVGAGRGVCAGLEPPDAVGDQDRRDLALLGTAWRLAEEVGAGASEVTAAAAGAVRARRAAEERAVALAAGPRASMWLLTALPLAGPVAGAMVGLGPDRLYASPAARTAAMAGMALTCGGWWWSQRLLARARRPGRTSGSTG